jgi:hypothetical protein
LQPQPFLAIVAESEFDVITGMKKGDGDGDE